MPKVRLFVGSFLDEDEAERIDRFGRARLAEISEHTRSTLRFVKKANLHMTWAFIGEVEEPDVPIVAAKLQQEVEFLQSTKQLKELMGAIPGITTSADFLNASKAESSTNREDRDTDKPALDLLSLSEKAPVKKERVTKPLSIDLQYDYFEAWPSVYAGRVLVATPEVVPEQLLRIGMSLRSAMANIGSADKDEPRNQLFRPHLTIARLQPPDNFGDGNILKIVTELLPIKHQIRSLHLIKSDPVAGLYKIIDTPWG